MPRTRKRRVSSNKRRMTTKEIVAAVVEKFDCLGGRDQLPEGVSHNPTTVDMYLRQPGEFKAGTEVPAVVRYVLKLAHRK